MSYIFLHFTTFRKCFTKKYNFMIMALLMVG